MNINGESSDRQKSLKLWPETLEWLNRQQNPSQTIDMLVASARKAEQQLLKDNTNEEVSAVEEQLEVSQEQVKTLQAELNAETQRVAAYWEELEYIKQQSCDRVVDELQSKLTTADLSEFQLSMLTETVMRREGKKDGKALIDSKTWFAVRGALKRFIAILSQQNIINLGEVAQKVKKSQI